MTLSQKETELLKDLQKQEQLCIDKYDKYAVSACSPELKNLFSSMAQVEREHLNTINQMLSGTVPAVSDKIGNSNNDSCGCYSYSNEQGKKNDEFLCQDMLSTEKHTSSLYDTSVFEFKDPQARKVLNHIQAEEQQHGEQIYTYMKNNKMYS